MTRRDLGCGCLIVSILLLLLFLLGAFVPWLAAELRTL